MQMMSDDAEMTIRVVLVDDHTLVRAGIRVLIEEIDGVHVVAEASDGREALRLIAEHRPDLAFLDLTMPGLNGFQVLDQVTKRHADTRVIVLTVHDEEEYAVQALRAGAAGYLPKSAASSELELAVRTVMNKGTYISPELSKRSFLAHVNGGTQGGSPLTELTPRQHEVLRMIVAGDTTKDIALKLSISVKTVESHRAQLMERLNIHDVAGLVRYAIKMGLVKIDESEPI